MQRKREHRKSMADRRKTAAVALVCIILIFAGMILVSLYYAREKEEEGTEKSVAENTKTGESGIDESGDSGNQSSDEQADSENEASVIGQEQSNGKEDGASQGGDKSATSHDGSNDTDDGNNTGNSSGENGEETNENFQNGENGNNAGDDSINGGSGTSNGDSSDDGGGTSNGGSSNGGNGTSNGGSSNGESGTSNGDSSGDGSGTSNGNSSNSEAETTADSGSSSGSSGGGSSSNTTDEKIRKIIDGMTLEEKVAQLFVVTPEQLTGVGTATVAGETTRKAIEACPVGGIIYFAKNIKSSDQIRTMLKNTQQYFEDRCGFQAFLMVDEEGGVVSRLKDLEVPTFDYLSVIGARGDTNEAYELGSQIGEYLSDFGFNMDTAPVADVLTNPENTVVKYRSFGSDCNLVSKMAKAEWQGLASENVIGIYKHFPGHGGTSGDTHKGYAYVTDTLEELKANALVPFQDAINAGVQVIMVGHISCPNVTGDETPASLSKMMITDILREDMGFDGIVITDALDMDAIAAQYTSAEAAVKALQAGADLLLMPADFDAAYQGVLDAVSAGTITEERIEESLVRILRVKLKM